MSNNPQFGTGKRKRAPKKKKQPPQQFWNAYRNMQASNAKPNQPRPNLLTVPASQSGFQTQQQQSEVIDLFDDDETPAAPAPIINPPKINLKLPTLMSIPLPSTIPPAQKQPLLPKPPPLIRPPLIRPPLIRTPLGKPAPIFQQQLVQKKPLLATPVGSWIPVGQPVESEADRLTASTLENKWVQFQQNLQKKLDQREAKKEEPQPTNKKRKGKPQAKTQNKAPRVEPDRTALIPLGSNPGSDDQFNLGEEKNTSHQVEAATETNQAQPEPTIDENLGWDEPVEQKPVEKKPEDKLGTYEEYLAKRKENDVPVVRRDMSPTPDVMSAVTSTSRLYIPAAAPSGVPRSFLKANQTAMQPQDTFTENPWIAPEPAPLPFDELHVDTSFQAGDQQYSPSDMFGDQSHDDLSQAGASRLSAFQRLGPVASPKHAKMTINLLTKSEKSVREVDIEEDDEKYLPVLKCKEILESQDETVQKYLPLWPWKRNYSARKTVTARNSKSVMLMEQEQMEELYERDNMFFIVSVRGYPTSWTKEDVIDTVLEELKGKSFIPCFVEFAKEWCKFAVIRSRASLSAIHKMGFVIRHEDIELKITISNIDLSQNQIDFIPRLVLRKRLAQRYDGERKLDLSHFTLDKDISHFIYFPLNRLTNQSELLTLQSTVAWNYLTDLNLSRNRLTTIDGFNLTNWAPKLKNLDLSHNKLELLTELSRCRGLALRSIRLEGNPLCHDYTDPAHYIKVLRMIFPGLVEIDGIKFQRKGEFPEYYRNYCPEEARPVVEKFLEVFFTLLDSSVDDRCRIEDLYHEKAVLTITHRYKMRYKPVYRHFRSLFSRARCFAEGEDQSVNGSADIARLLYKWPVLLHDPYSFSVDVLHHTDTTTIIRITGLVKQDLESLAEDEHLLSFTRTVVLTTDDGCEYRISNEMLCWEEPSREVASRAFRMNTIKSRIPSLKPESPPDEEMKLKLVEIFMQIIKVERSHAEKCLESKEWNLRSAVEYYAKLVKMDELELLNQEINVQKPAH